MHTTSNYNGTVYLCWNSSGYCCDFNDTTYFFWASVDYPMQITTKCNSTVYRSLASIALPMTLMALDTFASIPFGIPITTSSHTLAIKSLFQFFTVHVLHRRHSKGLRELTSSCISLLSVRTMASVQRFWLDRVDASSLCLEVFWVFQAILKHVWRYIERKYEST